MTNPGSTGRQSPELVRNVQALRGIAALLVVLVHSALPHVGVEELLAGERPWLEPFHYIGLFGVDLFFVISGFIMVVTNWSSFGRPRAGVYFLARRAIRIYPPYWLALLAVLPAFLLAKERFMVSHVGVRTGILESIFLLPQPNHFVLTVAWTLVWEMIFYAVFALLLNIDRRYVLLALGAWFVVQLGMYVGLGHSSNFYAHFASAPLPMEFIFGALIGLLYLKRRLPAPYLFAGVALLATAAGWSTAVAHRIIADPNDISRIIMFGIPAALVVYTAVAFESRGLFVAPAALVRIGDGSYAIYLWHLAILVALRQVIVRLHPSGPLAHAAVIALTLATITLAGLAVYHFFEKPVTRYLNGLLRSRPKSEAAALRPLSGALTHKGIPAEAASAK